MISSQEKKNLTSTYVEGDEDENEVCSLNLKPGYLFYSEQFDECIILLSRSKWMKKNERYLLNVHDPYWKCLCLSREKDGSYSSFYTIDIYESWIIDEISKNDWSTVDYDG